MAEIDANALVEVAPKDARSCGMRAQVWYMRKDWNKAIEDYSDAYRLSFGNQIDYGKGLANSYMQNGDWKLGMVTATDCLRLEADMYLCRGLCRRKLNDLAGAG